jgi:hypothetical protein
LNTAIATTTTIAIATATVVQKEMTEFVRLYVVWQYRGP